MLQNVTGLALPPLAALPELTADFSPGDAVPPAAAASSLSQIRFRAAGWRYARLGTAENSFYQTGLGSRGCLRGHGWEALHGGPPYGGPCTGLLRGLSRHER